MGDQQIVIESLCALSGRIGLFGGSFDPVHKVHVQIARELLGEVLDSVVYVPAARNPLKSHQPVQDMHRIEMLKIALRGMSNVFICTAEIERPGPSFTVDTLKALRGNSRADAKFFWIIGDDCLNQLPMWKEIDTISTLAELLVIQRNFNVDQILSSIEGITVSNHTKDSLRKNLYTRPGNAISSSNTRKKLIEGLTCCDVEEEVLKYIEAHKLYQRV